MFLKALLAYILGILIKKNLIFLWVAFWLIFYYKKFFFTIFCLLGYILTPINYQITGKVVYENKNTFYIQSFFHMYRVKSKYPMLLGRTYKIKVNKFNYIYKRQLSKKTKLYFHEKLRLKILRWLKKKDLSYLGAFFFGDINNLTFREIKKLKNKGIYHYFISSSINIFFLIKIFHLIFSIPFILLFPINRYKYRRFLLKILVIFTISVYFLLTLGGISMVRAIFIQLAPKNMKKRALYYIAFIFLLIEPNLLFNFSFQLSFLLSWFTQNQYNQQLIIYAIFRKISFFSYIYGRLFTIYSYIFIPLFLIFMPFFIIYGGLFIKILIFFNQILKLIVMGPNFSISY